MNYDLRCSPIFIVVTADAKPEHVFPFRQNELSTSGNWQTYGSWQFRDECYLSGSSSSSYERESDWMPALTAEVSSLETPRPDSPFLTGFEAELVVGTRSKNY